MLQLTVRAVCDPKRFPWRIIDSRVRSIAPQFGLEYQMNEILIPIFHRCRGTKQKGMSIGFRAYEEETGALVEMLLVHELSFSIQCIGYEKTALLEFKNDLIDRANQLVSWNRSNEDCCKWYGITCNNLTGHVSEIRLRGPDDINTDLNSQEVMMQTFGGKVNPSLQNLTSLEYLDLSCNNFGGSPIPTYIGSLQNLKYLNLSESKFSGEVPSQLGDLSKLQVLSLGNLYTFDDQYVQRVKSLQWLSGLSFLRHLVMSGVHLGDVFDWLQVTQTLLPSTLVELRLSDCRLPPITPGLSMVNFGALSILDLSLNNFSGSPIPCWITGLHNLVSLKLVGCHFNGLVPAGLMNMMSLTALDLSYNRLTGIQDTRSNSNSSTVRICNFREIDLSVNEFGGKRLLDVLHNLSLFECESSKIESLSFVSSGLSGSLPPQLGYLKNLVHLSLGKNSISGPIPDSIGRLSSLQSLHLYSNFISGPLPDSLGQLSALKVLSLSRNKINGTLPRSIGQLTKLEGLYVQQNLLTGVLTEDHFANLTSLVDLWGDANMLRLEPSTDNWEPPFQLQMLRLRSWSLGPNFPCWLQNQTNMLELNLGNTGISDNIPSWFWSTFTGLQYLNISDNNLSSVSLNDFLCGEERKQIIYMDLGNTKLSGLLPDCWTNSNWEFLNIIDFPDNNLTGEIPTSLANLSSLESLTLYNNSLSGELPVNLMASKRLQVLDLSINNVIGGIPVSAGGEATNLKLLGLRSNKLHGTIPDEICRLESIQILDLADNNLSGRIPKCFNNFSVMTGKVIPNQIVGLARYKFMTSSLLMTKGSLKEYSTILGLVTFLDLSGNDLHGVIPSEITQLVGLRFLNFSGNRLTGRIPENIGDMKLLENFDLSRNQLDGMIPVSMSKLSFLNGLNLSYNSFTGRIPSSTQIQSFHESSFVGNRLCGAPVSLRCERQGSEGVGDGGDVGGSGGVDGPDWGLITSIVVGFVVGFWIIVVPLVGNKLWRTKYYQFLYDIWCKFCGS